MTNNVERRFLDGIEATAEGKLVGYAAVYDSPSHDLGGVIEIIKPGAFERTLRSGDIRALINHDSNRVIGRQSAGTLRLESDSKGLRFEITPPDTQAAKDLVTSIKRGDVDGCSFAFIVPNPREGQRIDYTTDIPTRYLLDVDVREISVGVAFPAYEAATVALRYLDELRPVGTDIRRKRLALESLI